jgi:hypothetical protein
MSNGITVECSTPIKLYQSEEWPTFLHVCPRIGDQVESRYGLRLTVREVIHRGAWMHYGVRHEAHVLLILHTADGSEPVQPEPTEEW